MTWTSYYLLLRRRHQLSDDDSNEPKAPKRKHAHDNENSFYREYENN